MFTFDKQNALSWPKLFYRLVICSSLAIVPIMFVAVGCGKKSSSQHKGVTQSIPQDANNQPAADLPVPAEPAEPAVPYVSKLENLREALEEGTVDDIRYFIANGDDFERRYDKNWSLLFLNALLLNVASDNPRVDVFNYLIENGADVNVKIEDSDNLFRTSLHYAAADGSFEVVKFLIEKGADVNAKDTLGIPPLFRAASYNPNFEVVKFLIEKGADVNATDILDSPLLHRAALNPNIEVVKFLIEEGADVNAKSQVGMTSLHWAAENPNIEVLKFLIKKGAEVNAKNNKGETPLDWAEDVENITILREAGGKTGEELNASQGNTADSEIAE